VLQAAALRHAGHHIDTGVRWVMVLFLASETMRYGENIRHFKARALRLAEEGDETGELRCLTLARALCDDSDPELIYDQAVGEHERGNLESALSLYEHALQINEHDVRIRKNLAAVRAALGR
jgi:Flp pilus assembly protein TadD